VKVQFHPDVLTQLQRPPRAEFETALQIIIGSSHDPRPSGTKKLVGGASVWRVRFGQYSSVYSIDDAADEITVFVVAKHSDAHR
jgi:mRNA interferase RelE/StbE